MGYVKIVVKNNKIYTIDGIDTTVKIDDDGIIRWIVWVQEVQKQKADDYKTL